ncbi:MAG: phosphoglycolate phosphatase [Clostridiales bacterium]|nr:phosphoglycolate phosphatase [Clostridiales bacterium]
MFRCVLFDLDGTLVDSLESIAVAGNKALLEVGLPPQPVKAYQYFAGDGADTLVKRALIAAGDEACTLYDKAYSVYKHFFLQGSTYHVAPFAGILDVLNALKNNKIKIGVISNKPHLATVEVVESLFGAGYFDYVIGHKEGGKKKPDPSITREAANALGVKPAECMYVGDTNVDMENGLKAGMFTVGVLWGFRELEELKACRPHAIIAYPGELLQYVVTKGEANVICEDK